MTATSLERKSLKQYIMRKTFKSEGTFQFILLHVSQLHHHHHHCFHHGRRRENIYFKANQNTVYSNLHNSQGAERKNSIAEDTFPVETNTHCRMLCHSMSRKVLGRMDNCPQQRSEHHLVQTLYTDSDNDMSR